MRKLTITSLLLVIALTSISAYLRLEHSGLGCPDWPDCYGMIGVAEATEPTVGSTYERLAIEARDPVSWTTPAHRLIASVLGLTILGMVLLSLSQKRDRLVSFLLLGLTVFMAWLGIYSAGLHSPAVVMGNLGGGFTMLGLLGWMTFRDARPHANAPEGVRSWVIAALVLLGMQITLGGLTSANFAATACQTLPDCHGSYLPGDMLSTAFDLSRSQEVSPAGLAIGGSEREDINKLHRIGAVITTATILLAGILALRVRLGFTAIVVMALVTAEFSVAIVATMTQFPIGVAAAHNWLAALLLLALLRLLALCNNRQALL